MSYNVCSHVIGYAAEYYPYIYNTINPPPPSTIHIPLHEYTLQYTLIYTQSLSLSPPLSFSLSHAVFFSTIFMGQIITVQPMAQLASSTSFSSFLSGANSQTLNHSSKPLSITCSHCNFQVGISPYKLRATIEMNRSTGAMELLDSSIPCTMLTLCLVVIDISLHWIERWMLCGREV